MSYRFLAFLLLISVSGGFAQTSAASQQTPDPSSVPRVREIFEFTRPGGFSSRGALIMDKAGNLYGTTTVGGKTGCGSNGNGNGNGCGTVFKLSPNSEGSWSETVLYTFTNGADGSTPDSSLVFDSQGNLYGTASAGGLLNCSFGCGTVFKLTPNGKGWTETTIYQFQGNTDGWLPKSNLVFDKAGNLYGTTQSGGASLYYGTVFKLSHHQDGSWAETLLHSFDLGAGGCAPEGVVADANDDIYGIAELCGARVSWGTVWKVSNTGVFSIIHTFQDNLIDGGIPNTGLMIDHDGNLYGGTIVGPDELCGGSGCGVIYKLAANQNWEETILHVFDGNSGAVPNGDVTFDAQGNLWGTTQYLDQGMLFQLQPLSFGVDTFKFNPVETFQGPNGPPFAGVVFDSEGNAYGTQTCGPKGGLGGVFEMTP